MQFMLGIASPKSEEEEEQELAPNEKGKEKISDNEKEKDKENEKDREKGMEKEIKKEKNTQERKEKKMKAFSLFSGGGGLSTGLTQTNRIKVKWAVDWDPNAAETFVSAHPSAFFFNEDAAELLEKMKLRWNSGDYMKSWPKPGEVDLLEGCPSCQGLTTMNLHRNLTDPRNL